MKELGLHKLKNIGCPTSGVFPWPRIGTHALISTPWTSVVGPCAALYKQQSRKSRLGWRQQTLGKGTSGKRQVIWKVCQNYRWVLDPKCLSISSSPHFISLLWCPPGTFSPEEQGHTSNLLSSLDLLCLPYNLITNPLPVPFRGQGGISLLKQHKKKFLPFAEGLGCGSGCARHLFSCFSVQVLGRRSVPGKLLFPPVPSAQMMGYYCCHEALSSIPASLLPPSVTALWQCSGGELQGHQRCAMLTSLPELAADLPANKEKGKETWSWC